MIVAPSTAFTGSVQGFASGIAADIGATIIDDAGATVVARATGATAHGTIPGLYLLELTSPADEDHYIIDWDDSDGNHAYDDLYVTSVSSLPLTSGGIYVSAAALKATLTLTGETFADADIAVQIEAASRAVDNYCGRFFYLTSAGVSRYFTADDSRYLRIDDLVSASEVAIDLLGGTTYATVLTAVTDYAFEPYNAAEIDRPYTSLASPPATGNYVWPTAYQRSIKITGQWGWPTVPGPIISATGILATRFLKRAREAPLGVVGLGIDGAAVRISRFDPDVALMLDPYCRRRLLV